MAGWSRARLDGAAPVWLLTFAYASRSYRLASRPIDIATDDGDSLHFYGSLPPVELDAEADLFASSPEQASVPLALHLPDAADVAQLHALGYPLEGVAAELSLHYPGDTYEQRVRILAGHLNGVTYGPRGEPFTCSLESDPIGDDAPILYRGARVSAATWPDAGEAAQGLHYPLVWGQPGIWTEPDGTQRDTSGSPAFIVDKSNKIILLADGRTEAGEQGLTVQLFNASADDDDQITAYLTTDGAGRTVTVANLSSASLTVNGAHQYYVRWDNGGGAIGRRDEVVSNLGELVWYVLHRSGAPFDRGRVAALIPWLSQIPTAGYIDDPATTAWDWLGGNVLDLVPAGVAAGPEGPYLVPWLLEAYPQSAARSIRVGEGVYRIPGQAGHIRSSERDELANLPRLSYSLRVRTGVYQGEAALVADPNEDGIPSARAALSVGAYGPAEAALTSDIIYEGAAAVRILNWHLSAYGQPQRRITYLVSPRLADLDPGALVQLTDADLYLTDQLATVVRRGWADGALEIELLLHPDDSL